VRVRRHGITVIPGDNRYRRVITVQQCRKRAAVGCGAAARASTAANAACCTAARTDGRCRRVVGVQ
jgi:hypothetical protein